MLLRLLLLFTFLLPAMIRAQPGWIAGRVNLPNISSAHSIAFGNGRFVVTLSGTGPNAPAAAWSIDGETWHPTQLANPARDFLPPQGTVRFINGAFFLAGGSSVYRSIDGVTWASVPLTASLRAHRGIASDGHGMLIASANSNDTDLLITADGTNWRRTAPLPDLQPGSPGVNELAYVGGRYFVSYYVQLPNGGLRNSIVTTTDGGTWEPAPAFVGATHLASGNGRMVAYGINGTSVATTDGRTYVSGTVAPGIMNGGRMGFAGGRFFFIGSLYASLDGLTWAPLASAPNVNGQMMDIAYGNGRYVAVGYGIAPGAMAPVDIVVRLTAGAPPVIAAGPAAQTVAETGRLNLTVTLENPDTTTTFQWHRDGQPIAGATTSALTIAPVVMSDTGRYTVDIRNSVGTTRSEAAAVVIVPVTEAGRIVNLSVLTSLDSPDATLSVGFVVGGAGTSGNKALLVRAGGPSLARFGVEFPHPDPKLELFGPAGKFGDNDQWSGTAALIATANAVGAFPFASADSRDAAIVTTVARDTTAIVSSNNATGSVIAEVYDATPAAERSASMPRLLNVSVLKPLPASGSISAGFVIGGRSPKTVLIRAVGPTLSLFSVDRPAADPRLTLFRTGILVPLAANEDWSGTTPLRSAMLAVGAFELPGSSKDAALLLTLEPGDYVAQANVDAAGGSVLVEVYDVP